MVPPGRRVASSGIPTHFADTAELSFEEALDAPLRSLPRPSRLNEPLKLSKQASEGAAVLGLHTLGDLLEHLPRRHADRGEVQPIASLSPEEEGTVEVEVRSITTRAGRNRRQRSRTEARVADESGPMLAVWFNRPWVAEQVTAGDRLLLRGRMKDRNRFWVSTHEAVSDASGPVHTVGVVPVYPGTKGLGSDRLRELVSLARERVHDLVEPLPAYMRASERLPDRPAAIAATHFPEGEHDEEVARRRLAFEELFLLELALSGRRRARQDGRPAPRLEATGELVEQWLAGLPFEPTGDQRAAFERIDADLAGSEPMQRLLMGEIGSGKTVVALHAMLRASENAAQAALMAPTETLAEQHLATLDRLLGGMVPIALLTGSTPAARRRQILERLASGELRLVVGTHALIEPVVEFRELALVVIDEQHRFGVRQRAALDAKAPRGMAVHALHLTATPIPRTLALTLYRDLETTTLRELPAGRKPVETHVVDGERARRRAYERIREEIGKGRQCYVVCPLVSESEALQARAATVEAERLARTEFRDHRVALIHGQMSAKRKAEAMAAFSSGEADVLVATSVIEVGIDVPNASVMLIEAAERYGLSQLHQLRGRIGRGEHESLCIMFGDPSLPRLQAIAKERDGFKLAEVDLELRKEGDILGTRQHGEALFRVARLPEDLPLLELATERAEDLLARDPKLAEPEHVLLRDAVATAFGPEYEPIPV
ncbi:MAG TPA: ATP-dependent DNA helicase RecG [Thermoleophilaceae bacterium]|nr:ATP-dependent DNA helicase RecG [Thermoleophilaceae bacterium]